MRWIALKLLMVLMVLMGIAQARAGAPIKIELPLFEGGAGKDFFLDCAREYELCGTWDVELRGEKEIWSFRDGKFLAGKLGGKYENVRTETNAQRWNMSADGLVGTILANPESFSGEVKVRRGGIESTQQLIGKKRDPVIVDMYLDPRIEDKVRVRILEGTFFEVTNAFINYWPLVHNGKVLELNKFLDQPNWEGDAKWGDTFLPGSLNVYVDEGKIYSISLGYYASVIWYNKKMFRDHGWKTPVTWDDLFALCDQVKKAGIAPLAFQGRYPYYAAPLYEAAFYNLAGPKAFYDQKKLVPGSYSRPESVEAIRLVQKLATEGFQAGALGMSHTESQLQFFLGNTAMIPCGAWLKSEMMGKIPDGFELGCFNLPVAKNGVADPTAVSVHTEATVVMSESPHPELGVDFLRLMTSRRMAGKFARMQDIPTCIRGSNEGNLSKDLEDLNQIVNNAKTSYGMVPGENYPEFEQIYRDGMYRAISGGNGNSPAQVAQGLESQAISAKARGDNPDQVTVNHRWKPAILLTLLGGGMLLAILQMVRLRRHAKSKLAPIEELQRMRLRNVLLFVGPAVVIYSMFIIVPCVRSFTWSVHQWNGLTNMGGMPFKGLMNFRRLLLESDTFWISLQNNLFLMVVVPLFVVPLALFLSACISRGVFGSTFFRVVFFFPNLLGGVAATLLWLHVYNPQGGLINAALTGLGGGFHAIRMDWLAGYFQSFGAYTWLEPKNLYWSLIPISIWGACGFNMVLYLAAMETIPETYYEAARIDGASALRQFWTITVPLIWEVLLISLVFLVIGGMKAFETIWLLTNQQPQTQNHVISTLMIQTMFNEFKVGEATAMAVVLFLMIFVGTAAMLRGLRRETVEM
jgi:ABC-type sugar transport system permease subunit/ABC-type glycerol-3-phosphate transport system substrate-binding protein